MQLKNRYRLKKFLLATIILLTFQGCKPYTAELEEYEERDKTVLVYMVANNNLSEDAFTNIEQMERGYIPSKDQDNLIIYSHTENANPKLIHLYKDQNGDIVKDTVYHFPYINSATTTAVTNALNVVNTMYPAKERGLILWSHATGWLPTNYYNLYGIVSSETGSTDGTNSLTNINNTNNLWPTVPSGGDPYANLVKSFGSEYQESTSSYCQIEIPDLKSALPYKLDYIIFDACFMGGIENLYELKDSTDYIVASAAEVLTGGFGYEYMMEYLFDDQSDLVGMAESIYNYYNSQSGISQSITISVVKCSELPAVAESAASIFDKYRDNISSLDVTNIQGYFRYSDYWYYDINDFIKNLASTEDAEEFTSALSRAVVYKATTGKVINITINPAKFSGVSSYIPSHPKDETLEEYYRTLEWEKAVNMLGDIEEESEN